MTDSNAAARVIGSSSSSSSIPCTVPHQQASPPDHRVPLPAPRCPPVPRRLLWHDSSGKKEEDQRLQAGVQAGAQTGRILVERAHRNRQCARFEWRGYNHIKHLCDTSLVPAGLSFTRGVRAQGCPQRSRPMCPSSSRAAACWHRGTEAGSGSHWTQLSLTEALLRFRFGLHRGSTHLCLTVSSDARPHSVGTGRVPVSCAVPQARQAVLAAPVNHLHLHSHGLHPEHSL